MISTLIVLGLFLAIVVWAVGLEFRHAPTERRPLARRRYRTARRALSRCHHRITAQTSSSPHP